MALRVIERPLPNTSPTTWTAREIFTAALVLPIVYSLVLPFLLLDLWIQLYQASCFRLLGLARVHRRDYVAIDRHRLPYLSPLQKVNCAYCGYVNGVIAFTREVAGRTEQYWCPIKHERRARVQHRRQRRFAAYGDAPGFERLLPRLRQELAATPRYPISDSHARPKRHP
jgi:hypothetical protein